MPIHEFVGFVKFGAPVFSKVYYNLPNDNYPHWIAIKKDYHNFTTPKSICDLITTMCQGNVICTYSIMENRYNTHKNIIIYFQNAQDVVTFKLATPNIIDALYVKDVSIKQKDLNIDIEKLKKKLNNEIN